MSLSVETEMKKQKKISRRKLILLAAACIFSVAAMLFALSLPRAGFVPPPFDAAAQTGTPEVPAELGYAELELPVYTVALCGKPAVQEESAELWLTNPATNAVWLKVRIYGEEENLLGESGLLRPGEYVEAVSLQNIPARTCPVTLKVMGYEPETYRSAGAVSLNATLTVP